MVKMRWMLLCMALAASLSACGGGGGNDAGEAPAGDAAPPAETENGAAGDAGGGDLEATARPIYEGNCMACHGTDLAGAGSFPSLQQVGADMTQEEIAAKIAGGGNGMPAFEGRLTDDEIGALSQWLAAMK
ncbi:cytochrome c [Paenibacillus antri]|uniref:Cytochrome c n=1 Tax=Paenibacillus antri TaxID=2582848 RepID=A0A5R9GEU5_9BACL|nr:cytochrome c [Paenibacillus antri]TLS52650.1 cytochrome c [Paenibacillus antri]